MTNQNANPPVATLRDGAISAKVWRNFAEGQALPFYSVTFQRTYTDPATEQPRETHSFGSTDILKVQQLASEAYRTVSHLRTQDRAELRHDQDPGFQPEETYFEPQATPQPGLELQRDAAMNAAPQQPSRGPARGPAPER